MNTRREKIKNCIDHKYSTREAFDNDVPIEIITLVENSRKNKRSIITLDELKKQIVEVENDKN